MIMQKPVDMNKVCRSKNPRQDSIFKWTQYLYVLLSFDSMQGSVLLDLFKSCKSKAETDSAMI